MFTPKGFTELTLDEVDDMIDINLKVPLIPLAATPNNPPDMHAC